MSLTCEEIIHAVLYNPANKTLYDVVEDVGNYIKLKEDADLTRIKTLLHPDKIQSTLFNNICGYLPKGKIVYSKNGFNFDNVEKVKDELKTIKNNNEFKTLVITNQDALCKFLKKFILFPSPPPSPSKKTYKEFTKGAYDDDKTTWFWTTVATVGLSAALLTMKRMVPHIKFSRQRIRIHTVNDKGRELFINRKLHEKIIDRIAKLLGVNVKDLEIETTPTYEDIIFMVPQGIDDEVLFNKVADEIENMGVLLGAELHEDSHIWIFALKK